MYRPLAKNPDYTHLACAGHLSVMAWLQQLPDNRATMWMCSAQQSFGLSSSQPLLPWNWLHRQDAQQSRVRLVAGPNGCNEMRIVRSGTMSKLTCFSSFQGRSWLTRVLSRFFLSITHRCSFFERMCGLPSRGDAAT